MEGSDERCDISHRHEWESEQHPKGKMNTADGVRRIGTAKRRLKAYAKNILQHLRTQRGTPLNNVVSSFQWLSVEMFVLIHENYNNNPRRSSVTNRTVYCPAQCSPVFEWLNLNEYDHFYVSTKEVFAEITNLFRNEKSVILTKYFIEVLYTSERNK